MRSPEETRGIVEPIMDQIGVTGVIDITSCDRLGIPCFAANRITPVPGSFRFHPGKGLDPVQARVSAMVDAVEKFSAERYGQPMELAGFDELGAFRAVDPEDLFPTRKPNDDEKLQWVAGYDLLYNEEVLVPANAVFHPYNAGGMAPPIFKSDPHGLAAGNVIEEAILHAILEVIETDALSCADRERSMGTRLKVDSAGPVRDLLDIYSDAGIDIHLWLLEGRTSIPTIAAAADDTVARDPGLLLLGSSCHPNPVIACLQALTEVARNRAARLYKGEFHPERELILQKAGYERMKRINKDWFSRAGWIDLSDLPDKSTSRIDEDIRLVTEELRPHVDRICVCDLSRTIFPVVRVVIPGLEVSHLDKERIRKGPA